MLHKKSRSHRIQNKRQKHRTQKDEKLFDFFFFKRIVKNAPLMVPYFDKNSVVILHCLYI